MPLSSYQSSAHEVDLAEGSLVGEAPEAVRQALRNSQVATAVVAQAIVRVDVEVVVVALDSVEHEVATVVVVAAEEVVSLAKQRVEMEHPDLLRPLQLLEVTLRGCRPLEWLSLTPHNFGKGS